MNKGTLIGAGCGALLVGAVWTGVNATAQDADNGMNPEAMIEAWKAAHLPGEHHKLLHQLVGEFTAVSEFKMGPDAPPMIAKATMVSQLEFDGRFVKSVYESELMGDPFTGVAFMGYDNDRKAFTSLWMDSMSTGMALSTGQCNDAGNEWTMLGEVMDPMGNAVKTKNVFRLTDDGYTMDFYKAAPDGGYGAAADGMMHEGTITYTRVD